MFVKVSFLPLYIRGVADLEYNNIILSPFGDVYDTFLHELAHLLIRDKSHSSRWEDCYRRLGGKHRCRDEDIANLLIDVGYMPNIGNISGIQNIY